MSRGVNPWQSDPAAVSYTDDSDGRTPLPVPPEAPRRGDLVRRLDRNIWQVIETSGHSPQFGVWQVSLAFVSGKAALPVTNGPEHPILWVARAPTDDRLHHWQEAYGYVAYDPGTGEEASHA
jgi:hypothetical protein